MPKEFERRSLKLTPEQWAALERLAAATGSVAPTGINVGKPSWRTMIKRIADDEFRIYERADPRGRPKGEKKMDRVEQVNWLREFAANIAQNLGDGTPEELVDFALSEDGQRSWEIEIPDWFDDRDREILVDYVFEAL